MNVCFSGSLLMLEKLQQLEVYQSSQKPLPLLFVIILALLGQSATLRRVLELPCQSLQFEAAFSSLFLLTVFVFAPKRNIQSINVLIKDSDSFFLSNLDNYQKTMNFALMMDNKYEKSQPYSENCNSGTCYELESVF